jgi:hypothetical protein
VAKKIEKEGERHNVYFPEDDDTWERAGELAKEMGGISVSAVFRIALKDYYRRQRRATRVPAY